MDKVQEHAKEVLQAIYELQFVGVKPEPISKGSIFVESLRHGEWDFYESTQAPESFYPVPFILLDAYFKGDDGLKRGLAWLLDSGLVKVERANRIESGTFTCSNGKRIEIVVAMDKTATGRNEEYENDQWPLLHEAAFAAYSLSGDWKEFLSKIDKPASGKQSTSTRAKAPAMKKAMAMVQPFIEARRKVGKSIPNEYKDAFHREFLKYLKNERCAEKPDQGRARKWFKPHLSA